MERRKVFQKKRRCQHFTLKQLLQIFFDIESTRKGKKYWNLIKTKKGVLQFARVLKKWCSPHVVSFIMRSTIQTTCDKDFYKEIRHLIINIFNVLNYSVISVSFIIFGQYLTCLQQSRKVFNLLTKIHKDHRTNLIFHISYQDRFLWLQFAWSVLQSYILFCARKVKTACINTACINSAQNILRCWIVEHDGCNGFQFN